MKQIEQIPPGLLIYYPCKSMLSGDF